MIPLMTIVSKRGIDSLPVELERELTMLAQSPHVVHTEVDMKLGNYHFGDFSWRVNFACLVRSTIYSGGSWSDIGRLLLDSGWMVAEIGRTVFG